MQVSKLLARIFIVLLLSVHIFQPGKVWAQAPAEETRDVGGQSITPTDIAEAINSPTPNLANTTAYVFYTITVLLTGTFDPEITGVGTPINPKSASLTTPQSVSDAVGTGGLTGGLAYLTSAMVKNPPASAGLYVADIVSNSRFAPQTAYAQAPGLGFGALNPILGTWKAFRNVAYYLLTIAGFVVGFLILIRQKVGGNTAVTVQKALPRLVITVILITFSYAIAGLMVDLLYLSIYFIINVFQGSIFLEDARFLSTIAQPGGQSLSDIAFNTHIFSFTINYVFSGQAWAAATSIGDLLYEAIEGISDFTSFIGGVDEALGGPIQWIVNQLFSLIFAIAIFIAMFRTFFSLIMSYAGFVINVVMAPFILLPGAMPGPNHPFGSWIKNLAASLAPFAVAIFMIFMAFALTGTQTRDGIGYQNTGNPEDMTGLRLPLIMSGADTSAFVGILAMGFILLLPEAVNMTRKALHASGGIFDEFKDKAVANFQKGWEGNKIVPGAKKIAPAMATGAVVGGGGAILGGAALGAAGGNKFATDRGWTGNRQRAAQVVGGLAGMGFGAAAAPSLATGAAFLGGGAVVATPIIKTVNKGVSMTRDKLAKASAVAGQIRDYGNENAAEQKFAQSTLPTVPEPQRRQTTASGPQNTKNSRLDNANQD